MSNQFDDRKTPEPEYEIPSLDTGFGVAPLSAEEKALNEIENLASRYDNDISTHENRDFRDAVMTFIKNNPMLPNSDLYDETFALIDFMEKNDALPVEELQKAFVEKSIASILEITDPNEQAKLLNKLNLDFPYITDTSKEFEEAVVSFLRKNPVIPGSPMHQQMSEIWTGKELDSSLFAGALKELQKGNRSDIYIETVTKGCCDAIRSFQNPFELFPDISFLESLDESDYQIPTILSVLDYKSRGEIYKTIILDGGFAYIDISPDYLDEYTSEFVNSTPYRDLALEYILQNCDHSKLDEMIGLSPDDFDYNLGDPYTEAVDEKRAEFESSVVKLMDKFRTLGMTDDSFYLMACHAVRDRAFTPIPEVGDRDLLLGECVANDIYRNISVKR